MGTRSGWKVVNPKKFDYYSYHRIEEASVSDESVGTKRSDASDSFLTLWCKDCEEAEMYRYMPYYAKVWDNI